jgi:hypothetical protein
MFPSAETLHLFDLVLRVIAFGLMWFCGWVGLFSVLVAWNRYKKGRDKVKREAERKIVKLNEDIAKDTQSITVLKDEIEKLTILRDARANEIKEMGNHAASIAEITSDDSPKTLTVKELRVLAKEHGIKGFSRMKKQRLLELLADHL